MGGDKKNPDNDKTSRQDFNNSTKSSDKQHDKSEPITEYDLQKKLDTFEKLTTTVEQGMTLAKLKQQHEKQKQNREQNRAIQAFYYTQGKNKGWPHADYSEIKKNYEIQDQMRRQDVLKEAKEVYRSGDTSTTEFNKANKEP